MSLSEDQKNRTREVIKSILLSRVQNFPDVGTEIRNAPFHSIILETFKEQLGPLNIETPYLVAIASWMHGLNTSLGFGFEHISHILSGGYKKSFTKAFTLKVTSAQAERVGQIIRDLKSGEYQPNLRREDSLLFVLSGSDSMVDSLEFTADVYLETDNEIVAIEMKSVRPNSGEGRGEKEKILYAKAALRLINPTKKIRYYVGFPFDPTSKEATTYDKQRFFNYLVEFKKFFAHDEILLGSELWDFLSGQKNTMEEILTVIREVVRTVHAAGLHSLDVKSK